MKTVALIPIKMNNERIPGKNTKLLYDGTPLIQLTLNTIKACREIDEVYVYCSKEEIHDYLLPGINYLKRDPKYDAAQADVLDMFYTFSKEVPADIYVLTHVTSPFLKSNSIDGAVRLIKTGEYDSAFAAVKTQEFMWKGGKPMNYDVNFIPRTQDLPVIYAETTGFYVFTKDVIQVKRSRIGHKPYIYEVSKIEAIDINDPVDFDIANAIYRGMKE